MALEKVREKENANDDEFLEEKNVIFVGGHDSVKIFYLLSIKINFIILYIYSFCFN
jgi:hypothetical protein